MIYPVETINLMAIGHWNDDLNGIDKELFGINENGLMDKVKEDKLACDVDDLSSLFVELEEGNLDVQLPFENEAEVMDSWIGGLEQDAVNVDELSAVFAQLVDEQASSLSSNDDADVEMSDSDEEDEDIQIQMVPCAPTWAMMAPLDPRSAIRTPVFKDVDSRIPRVKIPRMDLSFSQLVKPLITTSIVKEKKEMAKKSEYKHDAATCWICKSDKSTFKKFALHRYLAKRHRRNWKRGPRYSGRSNVATGRVRDGGRFIQTAQWI